MSTQRPTRSGESPAVAVRQAAVIDMGTASVRMAIADIFADGRVHKLEEFTHPVNLGRDTFTTGGITKATIEDCVRVLKLYRKVLKGYQIESPDQIRCVATSAVREANNRLAFIDRVYIATGFQVEPLDEAEVTRVAYLGVQPFLSADPALEKSRCAVVEIGGGSTELLLLSGSDVVYSHTYRLGSLRLRESLEAYRSSSEKLRGMMESHILRTAEDIAGHVAAGGDAPLRMIAMGGDVRFAARCLQQKWSGDSLARLSVRELEKFANTIFSLTEDEIVREHYVSFSEAEMLGPALLAYALLARELKVTEVSVTSATLRDGLLNEMAKGAGYSREFGQQIVRSAIDLGRRFSFDEAHAVHVANLASLLFNQLAGEHQLPPRCELILYIAAVLHEIGLFVSNRSYHKHSMYLIRNSELFGLGRKDQLLASLTARYHRRASPQSTHEGYVALERDERVAVSKMAALLRVAKALDESRSQRIFDLKCEQDDDRLVISIPRVEDLSLEQLSLRQNGSLFEEIFGLPVLLRMERR